MMIPGVGAQRTLPLPGPVELFLDTMTATPPRGILHNETSYETRGISEKT